MPLQLGRVDVLVNNAGIGTAVPATKETPEQFSSVVEINLHGTYWMAQAAARVMQPGSSIVNISSVLGLTTAALPQAAYSASKAGVIGLTRDLAQQWTGRKGIRVNAIAPGYFPTEMTGEMDPREAEYVKAVTPAGRLGDPMELAAVGVFGLATIVFGFSRWMPLSLGCLALLGAADMFSVYVRQSLIQLYTPDQMRGRVGAGCRA